MSAYIPVQTKFQDPKLLVAALQDMGFREVLSFDKPQPLHGYQGDIRKEKAEIIIRQTNVGAGSNDIGFAKKDGVFTAIISEYDRRISKGNSRIGMTYNTAFLNRLSQHYACHVVKEKAARSGYKVYEVQAEPGKMKLRMVKR